MPDVSLKFTGKDYTLSAKDYILQVQGTCISPFFGLDIPNLRIFIVGDVFLRKYYRCAISLSS